MTPTRIRRAATALLAVALLAGLATACGDDDDTTAASGDPAPPAETTEPAGELEITGAWARTSPAVATAGAAYLEIANGTDVDDVLLEASVDATVAARVELHETSAAPADGAMGDSAMGGGAMGDATTTSMGAPMMEMRPVEEIPVPAGETVVLEPGGFHIMLLDLAAPLEVGQTVELTLTFAEAGGVTVDAEVRDTAP